MIGYKMLSIKFRLSLGNLASMGNKQADREMIKDFIITEGKLWISGDKKQETNEDGSESPTLKFVLEGEVFVPKKLNGSFTVPGLAVQACWFNREKSVSLIGFSVLC